MTDFCLTVLAVVGIFCLASALITAVAWVWAWGSDRYEDIKERNWERRSMPSGK